MKKVLFAVCTIALLVSVAAADKPKNVYKTFHFTTTEVGITCLNGADPTGRKMGDILIISCGTEPASAK
jgi:hypothetical protein